MATPAPKPSYYARRCAADPEYRRRISAKNAEQYRKAKDADPAEWRTKHNAYWRTRYQNNPEFREAMKKAARERRARKKLLNKVDDAFKSTT
jgi:hypothetical protein